MLLQAPQGVQLFGLQLFALQSNHLDSNYLQYHAIIWTRPLNCGELRPDLTVHMHEQCILNQVGGGTGDHVISLKTKSFQSKLGASGEDR